MELFLLTLSALLRPILNIAILEDAGDIVAIGMFALLSLAVLSDAAMRKDLQLAATDLLILAFCGWCLAVYVIYFDHAHVKDLAKIMIPLLTYTVAKNVIKNKSQYLGIMRASMAGFALPIVVSAVMIALGKGLESINYWTGAPRYGGIYAGGHSLGHNMTLFLMTLTAFATIVRALPQDSGKTAERHAAVKVLLFLLVGLALYCLAMSRVRTAMLGLVVFLFIYLSVFNKKVLVVGATACILGIALYWPVIEKFLFPDVVMIEMGRGDVSELGSGRLGFWSKNLEIFGSLQLDQQLAGIGIGAQKDRSVYGIWDSHNDYLDILVQTGIVGLALFAVLQVALLRSVLRIKGAERNVYLALFVAVAVMNFVSNSYVSRFGLAQLYYIVLAYVEIRRRDDTAGPLRPVPRP